VSQLKRFVTILGHDGRKIISQSSHKKRMKIVENKGLLPTPNAMGWSLAVKTPADFQNTNKINCFEHVSYGMVLK
jgi:hypothetical protein